MQKPSLDYLIQYYETITKQSKSALESELAKKKKHRDAKLIETMEKFVALNTAVAEALLELREYRERAKAEYQMDDVEDYLLYADLDPDNPVELQTLFKEFIEMIPHVKLGPLTYIFRNEHPVNKVVTALLKAFPKYRDTYRGITFTKYSESDENFVYKFNNFPEEYVITMQDMLKMFTKQEIQAIILKYELGYPDD